MIPHKYPPCHFHWSFSFLCVGVDRFSYGRDTWTVSSEWYVVYLFTYLTLGMDRWAGWMGWMEWHGIRDSVCLPYALGFFFRVYLPYFICVMDNI